MNKEHFNPLYLLCLPDKRFINPCLKECLKSYNEYEKALHDICYKRGFITFSAYTFFCKRYLNLIKQYFNLSDNDLTECFKILKRGQK